MGAHIEITASDSCAVLGSFITDNTLGINAQVFMDASDSFRLVVDMAFLAEKGGLSGTILAGGFIVNPLRNGLITIDHEKTVFRDINNNDVFIRGFDTLRIDK